MNPANAAHTANTHQRSWSRSVDSARPVPDHDRGQRHRHECDAVDHEDHAQHLDVVRRPRRTRRASTKAVRSRRPGGQRRPGNSAVREQQRHEQRVCQQGDQPRPAREPADGSPPPRPDSEYMPLTVPREHADRHRAKQPAHRVVWLAAGDQHAEHGEADQEKASSTANAAPAASAAPHLSPRPPRPREATAPRPRSRLSASSRVRRESPRREYLRRGVPAALRRVCAYPVPSPPPPPPAPPPAPAFARG